MDPYAYTSPHLATAPDMFGDDQDDFTAMTLPTESNFLLSDVNDPTLFINDDIFALPASNLSDPFTMPPLWGFDGYLGGSIDFDESLFADINWGAEFYNQNHTVANGFNVPPPPSTASESQGLSPIDNAYLPYTPPEVPAYSPPMIAPFPPDAPAAIPESQPPSPPKNDKNTTNSHSLGPKRQLRKLIKPEACHICGKGHAQVRERDRHIITRHYDEAVRMGLDVGRASCGLCEQSFRRKDHLKRHMKRRHGW